MSDDLQTADTEQLDLDRLEAVLRRFEPAVVTACSWAVGFFTLFFTYLIVASAASLGR